MGDERCENCRYWQFCEGLTDENDGGDDGYGRCTRLPPVWAPISLGDGNPHLQAENWCQPVTWQGERCGEWRGEDDPAT